jgi:hypothetical protein
MDSNLLAMEVKPSTVANKPLQKDLRTLIAYLEMANYKYVMLLIYGSDRRNLVQKLQLLGEQENMSRFVGKFTVYWHKAPGIPAEEIVLGA